MDPAGKKRIRLNYAKLVRGLHVNEVKDYMYQYDLIDDDEMEKVEKREKYFSNKEAVGEMLKFIMSKPGIDVFDNFCKALKESGYEHVVDDLMNCDISADVGTVQDEVDSASKLKQLRDNLQQDNRQLIALTTSYMERIQELEKQNAMYKDVDQENRRLKDEMNRKGFTDKNVVDFVEIFMTPARAKTLGGAGGSSEKPHQMELRLLPNGSQIACRLSIDIVRYYVAIELCRPPPKPFDSIAVAFRSIVVEVVTKHVDIFEDSLKVMNKDSIHGFETLATIADVLFNGDGIWNWGRVVAWYAMCACIGRCFASEAEEDTLETFAMYIWFLINQRYQEKLEQNGGWDAFVTYIKVINNPPKSSTWMAAIGSYVYYLAIELIRQFPFIAR